MTTTRSKYGLMLVLATLCIAAAALAGGQAPVKGACAGTLEMTALTNDPGAFRFVATGSGRISPLGKVTTKLVFPNVRFDPATSQLLLGQAVWTGTIATANGDKLFGQYLMPTNVIGVPFNGSVPYVAELRITGGTGRFERATGTAMATGVVNALTLTFTVELAGSMTMGKGHKGQQ